MLSKKGVRVKARRDNLFHALVDNKQRKVMRKYGNSLNFLRTTLSSNGKTGRDVFFDDFTSDLKDVHIKIRNI